MYGCIWVKQTSEGKKAAENLNYTYNIFTHDDKVHITWIPEKNIPAHPWNSSNIVQMIH